MIVGTGHGEMFSNRLQPMSRRLNGYQISRKAALCEGLGCVRKGASDHSSNDSLDPFGSSIAEAVRRTMADFGGRRRRSERLQCQLAPQARAFVARYRERLRPEDVAALEAAANLSNLGAIERRWAVARHRLRFATPLKNAAIILLTQKRCAPNG